jgi:ATP-dependent helicase/nuclease subunit B
MDTAAPRVFTIASDRDFLEVLARAVLNGFPRADAAPPGPLDLGRWTVLLPTRRAVRELEDIFLHLSGGRGMLLPRIRPIGDIDEDLLAPDRDTAELGKAISRPGQILLLMDLIDDWASQHPASRLAMEIAEAPHLAHGLAESLADFLDAIETEDVDAARIPELYGLESARHREAILEFLAIARESYPRRLSAENCIGPQARRSAILRREAARLTLLRSDRPFIAAGSTGSIPATCTLLKAIASLPNGAVVLPGLDQLTDEASWTAIGPTHPQHALKQLLARLKLSRQQVGELEGGETPARRWLASEMMRPAETAHQWHASLSGQEERVSAAMQGVEMIESRSIPEQALTAALILRACLETPGRTGCLITPDRQLARRVKAELTRWNIQIDDSAGEPLIHHPAGSLLHLIIEALLQGFSAATLAALLRHDLACFGAAPEAARQHASRIELALLRTGTGAPQIDRLSHALRVAVETRDGLHLVLRGVTSGQWEDTIAHAARISTVLSALAAAVPATLEAHLDNLMEAARAIAGERLFEGEGGPEFGEAIALLREDSRLLRSCDLGRAAAIIRDAMRRIPVRRPQRGNQRLSILGLLEARLMRADVVVLAGLNEGTWPGAPDSGPWLNRPMRDVLQMKQPEAQIGQTAHDFAQAFGNAEVKLLWARRIGDAPATASRWVHRLQMILETAGLRALAGANSPWPVLARRLAEPAAVTPCPRPRPCPPVSLRPGQLSVTRIEVLRRDPYAIYARHILRLEPVEPISAAPDPKRRGLIFHAAIGKFLETYPKDLPADARTQLELRGKEEFAAIADYPEPASFWWPRFRRIAAWLAEEEKNLRLGVDRIIAETSGRLTLDIPGMPAPFALTCRADRIDLMADGSARILDYKTGKPPTKRQVEAGLSPQLTLQAAILDSGGFQHLDPRATGAIAYVHITGGEPAGKVEWIDVPVMDMARDHLDGLRRLLTAYASEKQPYYPRAMMEREEDRSDYDHLSRFREWTLSGDLP